MSDIHIETINSTVIITLTREKVLNALNLNMVREIYNNIDDWNTNKNISGVIIKGAGERAFCAGGDIVSVYHAKNDLNSTLSYDFFREEYLLNLKIKNFTKPWISILNGIAMGGGLGLSVHGSHRIVTEKTITAMPETAIGLFPDVGGGFFLSRMKNFLGHYLAITGNTMNSADTIYSGIGTNYLESNLVENFILKIKDLNKYEFTNVSDILDNMATKDKNINKLSNEINKIGKHFSHNSIIDIIKSLKSSLGEWEEKILKTLYKKSPTSMAVSQKQLVKSKSMTFEESLKMEFRICQAMMNKHDFYEGVRANLVEKDRLPKWSPAEIEMVNEDIIDSHFIDLKEKELF